MNREISPPPTKKRRLDEIDTSADKTASPREHESEALSIYSWNINGITPFIQRPITSFFKSKTAPPSKGTEPSPSTASLRDFLRRQNWPTLLLLQEVKIHPDDESTKRSVECAVHSPNPNPSQEPNYLAFFCLPSDPYNARGFGRKVYGVCTLVREDFLQETQAIVRTVDWDQEGRFSIVETQKVTPQFPCRLSIWNIYAVNGTDNPYKDTSSGQVVGTRHDRKLAVHQAMLDECQRLEREGYRVVLAGDMNIARGILDGFPNLRTTPDQHVRNRRDFNRKFFEEKEGFKGVDTFRHVHGEKKGYTYYPRGRPFGSNCDRVDLVICSASLKTNIVSAGMLDTPAERGPSDHCPLFATFEFRTVDKKAKLGS